MFGWGIDEGFTAIKSCLSVLIINYCHQTKLDQYAQKSNEFIQI